jgi:SAM-dependent methyltransferase
LRGPLAWFLDDAAKMTRPWARGAKIWSRLQSRASGQSGAEAGQSMGSHPPIPVIVPASATDIDLSGYGWFNSDQVDLAQSGLDAVRQYLESHPSEQRQQLRTSNLKAIQATRSQKMDTLRRRSARTGSVLETVSEEVCGYATQSTKVAGEDRLPVAFERVSSNVYDVELEAWFDAHPGQLFLDLGAGLRREYRHNVVNTEIALLPTTDVLCFGNDLPFDDDTFEGAVSLAVLEHVPNPFDVAAELVRVIKPGGRIIVDWPFLQPVHGYPHHYFNATEEGARSAFESLQRVQDVRSYVPPWLHPIFALHWMVGEWYSRLPQEQQSSFANLTMSELLSAPPQVQLYEAWSAQLPENLRSAISAGTRLEIIKQK